MKTRHEFIKDLEDLYIEVGWRFYPDSYTPDILAFNLNNLMIGNGRHSLMEVRRISHEILEDGIWSEIYRVLGFPTDLLRKVVKAERERGDKDKGEEINV